MNIVIRNQSAFYQIRFNTYKTAIIGNNRHNRIQFRYAMHICHYRQITIIGQGQEQTDKSVPLYLTGEQSLDETEIEAIHKSLDTIIKEAQEIVSATLAGEKCCP